MVFSRPRVRMEPKQWNKIDNVSAGRDYKFGWERNWSFTRWTRRSPKGHRVGGSYTATDSCGEEIDFKSSEDLNRAANWLFVNSVDIPIERETKGVWSWLDKLHKNSCISPLCTTKRPCRVCDRPVGKKTLVSSNVRPAAKKGGRDASGIKKPRTDEETSRHRREGDSSRGRDVGSRGRGEKRRASTPDSPKRYSSRREGREGDRKTERSPPREQARASQGEGRRGRYVEAASSSSESGSESESASARESESSSRGGTAQLGRFRDERGTAPREEISRQAPRRTDGEGRSRVVLSEKKDKKIKEEAQVGGPSSRWDSIDVRDSSRARRTMDGSVGTRGKGDPSAPWKMGDSRKGASSGPYSSGGRSGDNRYRPPKKTRRSRKKKGDRKRRRRVSDSRDSERERDETRRGSR